MNKSIKKNSINLNDDSMKLIFAKKINFIEFKNWYFKNLKKIKISEYLTISEIMFKNYLLNPNANISKIILFYNIYRIRKKILNIL